MSAAAQPIRIDAPKHFQSAPGEAKVSTPVGEIVHELRQPLSAIEAIAYYVEMTLPPSQVQARQQLRRIQELVLRAESVLAAAGSSIKKPADPRG